MLVLTRRQNEVIVIDGKIRVTVVESKNGRVRLGVIAPPGMEVDRLEIHCRKLAEREVAARHALIAKTATAAAQGNTGQVGQKGAD